MQSVQAIGVAWPLPALLVSDLSAPFVSVSSCVSLVLSLFFSPPSSLPVSVFPLLHWTRLLPFQPGRAQNEAPGPELQHGVRGLLRAQDSRRRSQGLILHSLTSTLQAEQSPSIKKWELSSCECGPPTMTFRCLCDAQTSLSPGRLCG